MKCFWCNGRWLESVVAPVSLTDRGFTVGLGLFETMLAIDGNVVFPERHLARLRAGCVRFGWDAPFDSMVPVMRELLVRNQLVSGRAMVRLSVSGGSGSLNDLEGGADRVVWLVAMPAREVPASVNVCVSPWARNERSPLAGLKCASYAENLVALQHAVRSGFDETLFFNSAGCLCETATANIFLVREGRLFTPSLGSGCLPGVTRGVVMEIAMESGVSCSEEDLSDVDLRRADEVFLTSSVRGPVAVSRVGDRDFTPGPVAQDVRDAWLARLGVEGARDVLG